MNQMLLCPSTKTFISFGGSEQEKLRLKPAIITASFIDLQQSSHIFPLGLMKIWPILHPHQGIPRWTVHICNFWPETRADWSYWTMHVITCVGGFNQPHWIHCCWSVKVIMTIAQCLLWSSSLYISIWNKKLVDNRPPSKPTTPVCQAKMVYSTSVWFVFLLRLQHWNSLSLCLISPSTPHWVRVDLPQTCTWHMG